MNKNTNLKISAAIAAAAMFAPAAAMTICAEETDAPVTTPDSQAPVVETAPEEKPEESASGTAVATGMADWMMTGLAAAGIGIVTDCKRRKSDRK